jgi:hypothetical protein
MDLKASIMPIPTAVDSLEVCDLGPVTTTTSQLFALC